MPATIEERMDDDLRNRIRRVESDTTDPADQFIQTFKLTRHIYDYDPADPYADKEEYDPHPGKMIRDSLLAYLPQLEHHEFERCGHSPWIEKSAREVFFSTLCAWVQRKST